MRELFHSVVIAVSVGAVASLAGAAKYIATPSHSSTELVDPSIWHNARVQNGEIIKREQLKPSRYPYPVTFRDI